jgi:hypothetical protein
MNLDHRLTLLGNSNIDDVDLNSAEEIELPDYDEQTDITLDTISPFVVNGEHIFKETIPKIWDEMMQSKNKNKWLAATHSELQSHVTHNTFSEVQKLENGFSGFLV